jgi:tetratricopeptide (TPR) repeat protein
MRWGEMHEGMRHFARDAGLRVGREAAERALLLGLSTMPEDVVEWYARGGWRGRMEPYVAYWTEDEKLARRAGEAGWEVRQIKRPVSFEEGVPKEWRTAYVVAPFGFDLSAVERTVAQHMDEAPGGVARVRVVGWPVPEAFLWFILRDRQPVKEGEWITAYSVDRLSIDEPLSKFGEALKAKNYDEMKRIVRQLYEAGLNRTLWQIVYEFDRERAEAALEHLRQRYGVSESRVWERHDELYLTWLAFRLADEYAGYLRSGVGRGFKTKEEVAGAVFMPWLPVDLAPLFWLRLVGDEDGEVEFRAAWYTAVDMWFERMAAPHQPKKPAVARKAVELFNVFVGAGFKYEELFPPPPPKPEAAKPAVEERGLRREAVKPETAKPEIKPAERSAQKPAVEAQRTEERGLRREEKPTVKPEAAGPVGQKPPAVTAVEGVGRDLRREVKKPTAKPEAVRPEAVKPSAETRPEVAKPETAKPEAVKPAEPAEVKRPEAVKPEVVKPAAEAVEVRGLRREERPKAPVADVIPERVLEAVDYLLERFGFALDEKAAFKAKSLVTAKVKARLEKVAAKEPEFAHVLAEVAEHVLSSFGRLMASPDAARHAYEALFYYFEGYQTRDGEVLFAHIERTVREAVRRAEEAGIPDAEYRIKQFILEIIDILATAGEKYRRDALRAVSTVEKALRATAFAGLSAAALYSVYHGLYSEAVLSSVASAVALAEVGQFREAAQYVQRAAKTLYETAKEVFEHVKITVQRLVELFVEAVTRVLAWIDEHKAYLFLMAAVTAGAITLSTALNIWGTIELEMLAYAATLTPFVAAGVKEYSREEVLNMLMSASDPYEEFKKIAREANVGRVKLAEPWESLRVLIMPRSSEWRRLMKGKAYRELDERKKKALFYAVLALEEALGVYKPALRKLEEAFDVYRKDVKEREKVLQKEEVGEEPFKQDMYVADLEKIKQLAKDEEVAFKNALRTLRKRLNEYANRYDLGDLLNVEESKARELAEAETVKLSRYRGVNFGTKAYAALIAYREYVLGRKSAYGTAAWHWLEMGGSAWLLYYAPKTAYDEAKKAKVERPVAVEELVAEALRRIFLKPGADHHHSRFVELLGSGKLALMSEKTESAYVFKLYRLEEGGGLKELGIRLSIKNVGKGGRVSMVYLLEFEDVERWRDFFKPELEVAMKVAEEVKERLPVEDRLPYMLGWVDSDVAISEGQLEMGTSHLWQLAETHALFDWSYITVPGVSLTLEGAKPQFHARTSLDKLDKAIEFSAKSGWLMMLGVKAGLEDLMYVKSWDGLKRWVAGHWDEVIDAVKRRLESVKAGSGFDLTRASEELKSLKSRLDDDKIAREVVAPVLLLIQAEKLGVNETTLRYFGAVISGAIDGDGHVSAAMKRIQLISGEREIALLWVAAFAAYGIKTKIGKIWGAHSVNAFGDDAVKLARLYFLYGVPLLEGDERVINHKRAEAVKLGAEGLNIRWEGLREIKGGAAADLTISEGDTAVKYNVYLRDKVELYFESTDRSRAELAARLLRLAGVSAEVKRKGDENIWRVRATTDMLAAGRKDFRDVLAEIVKKAVENGWVKADKAERWLEKLESGRMLKEGWPNEVRLARGVPEVRFRSTNRNSIEQMAQRLRAMGLEEGKHFTMEMPEEGREGYILILRKGLEHAAWLSVHGEGEQQRLAADFVEHILQMAKGKVRKKVEEIVIKGMERRSLELERFEKKVEVNGKTYVVKVIGGEAVKEDKDGKKLLRIRITAEVDGVRSEYVITYGRYGEDNAARAFAYARGDAPGGGEADAERFAAVIKALTGKEPWIRRMKDGRIMIVCGREHLDGFMRYDELADAIERWLEETGR